ncbi:MAG: carotenoid biosynthesis protein [Chloroflexi bacterium]|nr:carotenoid biosynthesis protein [Chloroflexota bacterium]
MSRAVQLPIGGDPRPLRRLIAGLLGVYLFIYVFAVPMLMLDLVPAWGTWMGGFLLILQGSLLALWLAANAGGRGWLAAALIAVLSWAVEHVGVTTGVPFGSYAYTDVLGWKLGGVVPLPIPFAWLLVVPAAIGAARLLLGPSRRWIGLLAPLLALALDLLLEPVVAYIMDYWHWLDSGPYYGVPTANFMAWGVTALVLTLLTLVLGGRRLHNPVVLPDVPVLLYLLNLVQFTLVDLAYGYGWAALIGAAVAAVLLWRIQAEGQLVQRLRAELAAAARF